ncbi:MAG: hypothetical protein S4CHLAM81_02810 [Chlamydiales bacterium]|nr:hypothetical protein [Chlamydiales bacterium]MCH9635072.1 hypothetical protein [Chlamydiales bacterium]MCH9703635.1 TIGR04372 family glycosyltransferase [Chlamydiota bacterium]
MKGKLLSLFYWATAPIALILYLLRIRVLHTNYFAIGHLAIDPYTIALQMQQQGKNWKVILVPFVTFFSKKRNSNSVGIANLYLAKLWRQQFTVIDSYWLACLCSPILYHPILQINTHKFFRPKMSALYQEHASLAQLYKENKSAIDPILKIPPKDLNLGWKILRSMGLTTSDKFLCFFQRDNLYYPEALDTLRDSNIESLTLALEEAISQGYWCIRIGKKCLPLPKSLQEKQYIIDYPHTEFTSDFMDIFLLANCSFFLGSNSGINHVPFLFQKPSVLVNVVPFGLKTLDSRDRVIYKLQRDRRNQKLLSFHQSISSLLSNSQNNREYEMFNIELQDNSQDEIRDAMIELLNEIECRPQTLNKQLQLQFEKLDHCMLFSYEKASRIGNAFLEKYEALL